MSAYHLAITILGLALLAAAWLPCWLRRTPISLPMIYVVAGMGIPFFPTFDLTFDPIEHGAFTERLTELAVILSLTGAGLKLDRDPSWRSWRVPIRLLAVTMPLSILALVLFGWLGLGISLGAAILLGAVMAPTDPVLASDVQVGPPGSGDDDEVRFGLTAEAGLNDGLAFPFVYLAITVATSGLALGGLGEWLLVAVLWKIVAGIGGGLAFGALLGALVFRVGRGTAVSEGFFALTLTLLTYGATELIHGYGFLAVFVAALVFRRFEQDHEIHHALHGFSEQIERLLMALTLLLLGAAIVDGLLAPLGPVAIVGAVGFVVLARPLAGWLGLVGLPLDGPRRGAIAALGIRGLGSFYYLAYALNSGAFDESDARLLWAVAGLIVVVSIALHGAGASPLLARVRPEETEASR